jgi:hypothetical protein
MTTVDLKTQAATLFRTLRDVTGLHPTNAAYVAAYAILSGAFGGHPETAGRTEVQFWWSALQSQKPAVAGAIRNGSPAEIVKWLQDVSAAQLQTDAGIILAAGL